MKLFISYSHKDEDLIDEFIKHLSPLRDNGLIDDWHDRKILAGDDFQNMIDENIESSDLICLMISEHFLSSNACMHEKDVALSLKEKKGVRVIPIILKTCLWTEYRDLANCLAVPTDGKAVTTFATTNEGWVDSIKWIKKTLVQNKELEQLKIHPKFSSFLESTEILSKAHGSRESLKIDDIFISPNLFFSQTEKNEKINNSEIK